MDCEKFDQIIIDAVYDELDELTLAAAKRHADSCQHCQAAWSGLRATRKIGILPLVEAPAGIETRILKAAREAHRNLPWPKRVGRAISWAGSLAMRPQMAMAALLVLMLGSSIIFLRAKPDRSGALSRISVTERGVPEQQGVDEPRGSKSQADLDRSTLGHGLRRDEERAAVPPSAAVAAAPPALEPRAAPESEGRAKGGKEAFAEAPRARAPSPAPAAAPDDDFGANAAPRTALSDKSEKKVAQGAGPSGAVGGLTATGQASQGDAFGAAMDLFNAGRYTEAEKAFDDVEASRTREAPRAALLASQSSEKAFGCGAAAPKYESAWAKYSSTSSGAQALWLAAKCYKDVANYGKARDLLNQLRTIAGYRDKAEGELANLNILQQQQQQQVAAKARAAPPPPAKPAAKPAAPAPKATSDVSY